MTYAEALKQNRWYLRLHWGRLALVAVWTLVSVLAIRHTQVQIRVQDHASGWSLPQWIPWLASMAGLGALVWGYVRAIAAAAMGRVVATARFEAELGYVVLHYLQEQDPRTMYGPRNFVWYNVYLRSRNAHLRAPFEAFDYPSRLYWYQGRPIYARVMPAKLNELPIRPGNQYGTYPITIQYIRGTINLEKLLESAREREVAFKREQATEEGRYRITHFFGSLMGKMLGDPKGDDGKATIQNKAKPSSFQIQYQSPERPLLDSLADMRPPQSPQALNNLALTPELVDLGDEIRFWYTNKDWYNQKGIAWRRGYLFHGGPGTGKTSMARAIAEEFDIPVFIFDLSSMNNGNFIEYWNQALQESPCMILLEDIDGVFKGRDNVAHGSTSLIRGLTFDCLLNAIDGIERPEGLLLVITTNKLECVDEALAKVVDKSHDKASRPGRVDRIIEFKPMDLAQRIKLAHQILEDQKLAEKLAHDGVKDTAAQFQERCVSIALKRRYEDRKAGARGSGPQKSEQEPTQGKQIPCPPSPKPKWGPGNCPLD